PCPGLTWAKTSRKDRAAERTLPFRDTLGPHVLPSARGGGGAGGGAGGAARPGLVPGGGPPTRRAQRLRDPDPGRGVAPGQEDRRGARLGEGRSGDPGGNGAERLGQGPGHGAGAQARGREIAGGRRPEGGAGGERRAGGG